MVVPVRVIGRYALYAEIAAGGMATVHFGRLLGPVGFSRTVAIKRLHPQFAKDPEFVSMFLDEARVAARVRHPNVVSTLDVVATDGELFLVMDYIQGESLGRLARAERARGRPVSPRIAASIMSGVLHGLHAAHEARDERGEPLGIVHRDISPQNILIGSDGTARIVDFGVAKASGRIQTTREGHFKGKIQYMAPEQYRGTVTRKCDIYSASIVLWELLSGERLFQGDDEIATLGKALAGALRTPSSIVKDVPPAFDEVVMRGLQFEPENRFATAREMALALERCAGLASPSEVGEWVDATASDVLSKRSEKVAQIELSSMAQPPEAGSLASELHRERLQDRAEPATSPSNVAAVASMTPAAPPSRRRIYWVAAAALIGTACLTALVLQRFATTGETRPPTAGSNAATVETVAPPAPIEASAAPATALPSAAATATSEVATVTLPSAATSAPRKPPPQQRKADCNPPFTLDAQGHKHFKVECL